jgi:hypothetical protein
MSEQVNDLLAGALAVGAGNDHIAFLVDEEQVGYHAWLGGQPGHAASGSLFSAGGAAQLFCF